MKTKHWIILFSVAVLVCAAASAALLTGSEADRAEVYSHGDLVTTVSLSVNQTFTVGGNTITVQDGKIGVTAADCPDHYCMNRGFCSGGADIVCLPNRLVISFVADQGADAVAG